MNLKNILQSDANVIKVDINELKAISDELNEADQIVKITLNADDMKSPIDLMKALHKKIPLDDLHNYNWDAIRDSLYLDDINKGYILIAENILEMQTNFSNDLELFKDIFNKVSKRWEADYNKAYKLLIGNE